MSQNQSADEPMPKWPGIADSRWATVEKAPAKPPQVEAPAKAPAEGEAPKKKRRRVRKSTRDKRKRESEEWHAKQRLAKGVTDSQSAEASESGSSAGEDADKGNTADSMLETKVIGGVGPATSIPAVWSGSNANEDIIRRVRAERDDEVNKLCVEIENLRTELAAAKQLANDKNTQVKQHKIEIEKLNTEIHDPERGYAAQIIASEEQIEALQKDKQYAETRANTQENFAKQNDDLIRTWARPTVTRLEQEKIEWAAEKTKLQSENAELAQQLATQESKDMTITLLEAELDQYQTVDAQLTAQLDSLLQGSVGSESHLGKVFALGKNLEEARRQAQSTEDARKEAQAKLDQLSSRQSLTSSEISSINIEPIDEPKIVKPAFRISKLATIYDQPDVAVLLSMDSAGTQTEPIISSTSITGTQTSPIELASTSTQTSVYMSNSTGMQTNTFDQASSATQTSTATTKSSAMHTTASSSPVQHSSVWPKMPLWPFHVLLLFIAWLLLTSTMLSWSTVDDSAYLGFDDINSMHYSKDLAKVGIEHWLGVDPSWLA